MLSIPTTLNQAVSAVTGFSATPGYTTAPSSTTIPNGKSATVTAKLGTQPSAVDVHSASRNFSFLCTKPAVVRGAPALNAQGQLVNVPINVYTWSVRKGMTSVVGQPSQHGYIKCSMGIPAGADMNDPDNIAAMVLAHAQLSAQITQEIVNTAKTAEI
jgi:hypothetical protein